MTVLNDLNQREAIKVMAEHQQKQMELLQDLLAWELRTQDPLPIPDKAPHKYIMKRDPHNYWAPYR